MSREHTTIADRLSDYLDGGLDAAAHAEVEAHLSSCGACRAVLEELRAIIVGAGELGELQPPRDLWAGIEAVIRAPAAAPEAQVIVLPTARAQGTKAGARDTLAVTRPQLTAAAVVLIAASALTTWWVGPGLADRGARADATPVVVDEPLRLASSDVAPPDNLAGELAGLEQLLDSARARLDPNTVRVLERNLAVIEQAIADSQRALALDPENQFLAHHLERVFERKLTYLRDAARVIDWAG